MRRWVDRALRAEPIARRSRAWIAAVAVAAVLGVWWIVPRASAPVANVLEMTLPTGDHLVGVAGAKFEVEQVMPAHRRIQLHDGVVMFDVAHVVAGQRFEVVTEQLVATAKGTVFSVEADAVRTRVRVYEGVVEVEQADEVHALIAGAVWDSATEHTEIAMVRPSALAASIDGALRERVRTIETKRTGAMPSTSAPSVTSAPAPLASAAPTAPVMTAPNVIRPPVARPAFPTKIEAPKPSVPMATQPAIASDTPPAAAWSTDSVPLEQLSLDQLLATARADLATGKLADALSTAQLAAKRTPWTGAWWQVVADAQRGLGHAVEAAVAYDRAAHELTGVDRSEAGYSAAYLRHHDLHDDKAALASLDAAKVDAAGSTLEERALGLRAQILVALGRDARPTAKTYLAHFPHADLRAYMRSLIK
ncbi:MAG TPA: FecR family protein [Kofleriaceae bacterium]